MFSKYLFEMRLYAQHQGYKRNKIVFALELCMDRQIISL